MKSQLKRVIRNFHQKKIIKKILSKTKHQILLEGVTLKSAIDILFAAGEEILVPTGTFIKYNELHYKLQILFTHELYKIHCMYIIKLSGMNEDKEIGILIKNHSDKTFHLQKGMIICSLKLIEQDPIDFLMSRGFTKTQSSALLANMNTVKEDPIFKTFKRSAS